MPLNLPPAFSVRDFNGGYNSDKNFATLADNQSNNAKNVEITTTGGVRSKPGYRRMLNTVLNQSGIGPTGFFGTSASGQTILGHFQLIKSGEDQDVKKHLVAAGPALYDYTSQTAAILAAGLNSSNFWSFTQIQDPRSASDDIVVAVNGVDNVKIWNGTDSSAGNLSAVTNTTGVMPAKFVISLKNRLYFLNIKDDTDVDSNVKVLISGFSTTGAPRPQEIADSFFVGGSDNLGEITGATVLHDQLIIFKRNATFKFAPGSGNIVDTSNLIQLGEQVGCIAPKSIAVAGNFVIFLSDIGVWAFDGNQFQYIGAALEEDFVNSNKKFLEKSVGVYYRKKNQYWLAIPSASSTKNDTIYVYDLDRNIWYPPWDGYNLTVLSTFKEYDDEQKIICGDRFGYLHKLDTGFADGVTGNFTGFIESVTASGQMLVIQTNSASFPTAGDGIGGTIVKIIEGQGAGKQYTVIGSSSTNTLRLSEDQNASGLNTTSRYVIGGIDSYYQTKDFDFGNADLDKKFRKVLVRTTQEGNHDLSINYILDFKSLIRVPSATISLVTDGTVFGTAAFGSQSIYGGSNQILGEVSMRATPQQTLTGKNFALRFGTKRPFQPWEVNGFDIITAQAGRR